MTTPLGSFLLPDGFARPGIAAMLRETSVVPELGRYAVRSLEEKRLAKRRPWADRGAVTHAHDPVILVPGFLAGDSSLRYMAASLRRRGFRTYRSNIHANVGCTLNAIAQLETRLEAIVTERDRRVQIVGHSLGGMLARGIAVRRPDLVAGIITLGSPMLAPGAHHVALSWGVETLVRLSRAGVPGLMSEDCVSGECARQSFEESRSPVPDGVGFTAIYSRRDGICDWRACIDPTADDVVEVTASHVGLAVDPTTIDHVSAALRTQLDGAPVRLVG